MARKDDSLLNNLQKEHIGGKLCLITGATSGIGKEAAIGLLELGAQVVITARDIARGQAVQREIQMKSGRSRVELYELDLSSKKSIQEFVKNFKKRHKGLDLLINNAGVSHPQRKESAEGIEATFAVNHLGPFWLTEALLDTLQNNAPSRIINVASALHYRGKIDFLAGGDALARKENYSGLQAYNDSKLCNVIYTMDLFRKLQSKNVSVYAFHPGVVNTGLIRDYPGIVHAIWGLISKSPKKAAKPLVQLASLPDPGPSGTYFHGTKRKNPLPISNDPAVADQLRKLSESLG
ncbi:MAG TPA: short-chain dehydrogenase [Leptospiraceae bacterium]|nr:short-chain dehydrogenase [Spirochaetaceae bacterium]HBS04973.1 short-chain dehydrogenase [Leptospiraceae bacterium]|tara:strand:- start:19268 stop:20146 length:879 start_codon:yes stop_codon:yes gene_type:complete